MDTRLSRNLIGVGLAVLAVLAVGTPALAQGWIEPDTHRFLPGSGVERVRSDVLVTIDAERRVAVFEVEEVFRNRTGALMEGDYVYPIPAEAVFTNFSLFMGEQEMRGEMLPAEQARSIYEEIVRRRKDPALIELVGHGMLRARVFPIEPGDERRVILRYTQVLGRDGDMYRLRYPRVVALTGSEPREVSVIDPRSRSDHPFTLTIRVRGADAFATPYSPTHAIEVRERRNDELEIAHRGDGAARDFELFLPLRQSLVGASVLARRRIGILHAAALSPGSRRRRTDPTRRYTGARCLRLHVGRQDGTGARSAGPDPGRPPTRGSIPAHHVQQLRSHVR